MRTMSIIGIVLGGVSLLFLTVWNNSFDYEAAIGWGAIGIMYLIAFSIASLVKIPKRDKTVPSLDKKE